MAASRGQRTVQDKVVATEGVAMSIRGYLGVAFFIDSTDRRRDVFEIRVLCLVHRRVEIPSH